MSKYLPVCEPFLNGNENKYVIDAIGTGWISSSGKYVSQFEQKFSDYCNVDYGVAVINGTAALHLALKALKIGNKDEVIIPNFTMISSAFAVCYTGAIPVFVDADKYTWNIDPDKIEEKITSQTKAIMVVHLFGLPCDMDPIRELAKKYNLFIIEDAAEAHGAEYSGEIVGEMSDIAAFSFFANKNLTTGEGGMVVTNSKILYDRSRYLKNLAFPLESSRVYEHNEIGYNYRMSNLHAAIGLAQTEKANEYKKLRIRNGKLYREKLKNISGIYFQEDIAPVSKKTIVNVYWMNAILIDEIEFGYSRDEVISFLENKNIDTRLLFTGMNKQRSLNDYGCKQNNELFPVSDKLTKCGLYLPSASNLSNSDIEYICETLISFKKN